MKNFPEEGIDIPHTHDLDTLISALVAQSKSARLTRNTLPVKVKTLAVIGAGGHGHVVADAAEETGSWDRIVFYDDSVDRVLKNQDWQIAGPIKDLFEMPVKDMEVVVAIGNNRVRRSLLYRLIEAGYTAAVVIHPSASVSRHAVVREGTVVLAKAVVNVGAVVGRGCIVNTSASVDHDCRLDDGVHISPGANLAGNVSVGPESWIGIAACVREGIVVDKNVVVGAGSVVVKPIAPGLTVVGNPIRILDMASR